MPPADGLIHPEGFPGLPEDWIADWETFPASSPNQGKNTNLFSETWASKAAGPRALIIAHGLNEHGGRYFHFPHYLHSVVDQVIAPDNRGHGRSEGMRGYVDRFSDFAEDLAMEIRALDDKLKKRFGRSEIHLLGHSMGSLITLKALWDHRDLPLRSVCVSSPLIELKVRVPLGKKLAAMTLVNFMGSLQMDTNFDATHLSHDRAIIQAYLKDRLVHGKITPKLFMGMLATMDEVRAKHEGFAYPVLMVVPMADPVCDPEAAIEYYQRLGSPDKELKTYPSFFHESFNEIGKEKPFEDLAAWIKRHASA